MNSDPYPEATPDRSVDESSDSDLTEPDSDTILSAVPRREVLSATMALGLPGLGRASGPARAAQGCRNTKRRSQCAFIGKGVANTIERSNESVIGAGRGNRIFQGSDCFIGSGVDNHIVSANESVIGGGEENQTFFSFSVIGGGKGNESVAPKTVIGGGENNSSGRDYGVIGGGKNNTTGDGTIAGGKDNSASGRFPAIGGGESNETKGNFATVSGGEMNNANGEAATIGGGNDNEVSADADVATIAGGSENEVTGFAGTVGGGGRNVASGRNATVPGGFFNVAAGDFSFAAGVEAKAKHHNTFVWSDQIDFESTGSRQFLVSAEGGVGIGRNDPRTQLDVAADREGELTPGNHVAAIENTSAEQAPNVLALQTNVGADGEGTELTKDVHYITFFDERDVVGRIEGNGMGGVQFKSGAGDVAEMLPRRDETETIEAGDVVGIHGGEISRETADTDHVSVVSSNPMVVGNASTDLEESHEPVAFVGQVSTRVRGPAETGDVVVPSGEDDGVGVAVDPTDRDTVEDGPVVGHVWEPDATDGVGEVTLAVGLGDSARGARLDRQRETIESQADEIDALRRENAVLRDRVDILEERLKALEAGQSSTESSGPWD